VKQAFADSLLPFSLGVWGSGPWPEGLGHGTIQRTKFSWTDDKEPDERHPPARAIGRSQAWRHH
jgi:hypothetical protein